MAESDAGRRATGTVSTEEAERLSERFRPSWEDDPPTVPREPLAPRADTPAPAPDDLDWEVPTNPVPEAAPPAPPVGIRTEKLPAVAAPVAEPVAAEPPLGARTLKLPAVAAPAATTTPPVALAPPQPEPPAPEPEVALQIDVEELPPESKPSGIGEKYIPKEEGAPPVVLNDDVRAAELGAQAQLEAQHRARRAPTIARLKAIELPSTLVDAEPTLARRKSGIGWLLGLGVLVALVAGALVVVFGSKPSAEHLEPPSPAAATVAPATAAPPPPAAPTEGATPAPSAPQAPPPSVAVSSEPAQPSATPGPAAEAAVPTTAPSAKSAPAPKDPAPAPTTKSSPPSHSAPKAAPAAAKPAAKPAATTPKPAGGKAVIVRDSPF